MKLTQEIEIRALAEGWLTREQLDGLAAYLFGVGFLHDLGDDQANQVIRQLRDRSSPARVKQAQQKAEASGSRRAAERAS